MTIIRPSIVYGPFSKTWSVAVALKLQSGNWGIFQGHGDGYCNLIYVGDLVAAILLAAANDRAVGQTFNLNGPEVMTWNQYFQRFNAALGLPELKKIELVSATLRATLMEPIRSSAKFARDHFEIPMKRAASSFGLVKLAMKYAEKQIKTSPRPVDFSLYNRRALYVAAKARELLGFEPRVGADEGLALTVRWLEQVGLLN